MGLLSRATATSGDDLAGLGVHGCDDAVKIGGEVGIAELVLGETQGGVGGVEFGLGGAQIFQRGIVIGQRGRRTWAN